MTRRRLSFIRRSERADVIVRCGVFVLLDDPGELVKLDIPVFSVFIQLVWYSSYDLVHLAGNYADNLRDKKTFQSN